MTEEERQQLIALGWDPDKLDPHHPSYDPDYGNDENPSLWDPQGRLKATHGENGTTYGNIKWNPAFIQIARKMCEGGATNNDLCEAFAISEVTLLRWRRRSTEFNEAILVGKAMADELIEEAMFKRAYGYKQRSEKIGFHEGEVIRAPIVEHVQGDVRAQMNWLTNRKPREWRNSRTVEHSITESSVLPTDEASILRTARLIAFHLQRARDVESKLIDITPEPVGAETKDEGTV